MVRQYQRALSERWITMAEQSQKALFTCTKAHGGVNEMLYR